VGLSGALCFTAVKFHKFPRAFYGCQKLATKLLPDKILLIQKYTLKKQGVNIFSGQMNFLVHEPRETSLQIQNYKLCLHAYGITHHRMAKKLLQ